MNHLKANAMLLVFVSFAQANDKNEWIGKSVFVIDDTAIQFVDNAVKPKAFPFPAVVTDVDGDRLRLGNAWVDKSIALLPDQAEAHYINKVWDDPWSSRAWQQLGAVRVHLGELDAALKNFAVAIWLDPENADAYSNRSMAWVKRGEHEKAARDLDEAIPPRPKECLCSQLDRLAASGLLRCELPRRPPRHRARNQGM